MTARVEFAHIARDYDRCAETYRRDDEIEVQTENHRRLGGNLRRICRSFGRPIRVLEMGCGTGRYFHWLEEVELLVGADISSEMLKRAANPVCAAEITAHEIQLVQGNLYELSWPAGSFDFIYSLGVFGHGAELTPALCTKFQRWLTPGGALYFDAIEELVWTRYERLKKSVKKSLYPLLPSRLEARLQARNTTPLFCHTQAMVAERMEAAGFREFTLSSNRCNSPLWSGGVHLECVGRKPIAEASTTTRERFDSPARDELKPAAVV